MRYLLLLMLAACGSVPGGGGSGAGGGKATGGGSAVGGGVATGGGSSSGGGSAAGGGSATGGGSAAGGGAADPLIDVTLRYGKWSHTNFCPLPMPTDCVVTKNVKRSQYDLAKGGWGACVTDGGSSNLLVDCSSNCMPQQTGCRLEDGGYPVTTGYACADVPRADMRPDAGCDWTP